MTKSDLKQQQYDRDKNTVLEWLRKYAYGAKNTKTREFILQFILSHKQPADNRDRYFRGIMHDLIHDGLAASLSGKGYWATKDYSNDQYEVEMLRASILERKARAMASLEDADRQLKAVEARMEPQLFPKSMVK
ncbi:MAG: hypothetical protein WC404_00120 [Candidatus Omnitrophota bacterium]|jgi:hypothetical protein